MPPQRRILQEIDQNTRRRPNLTVQQRNQIIGMLHGGATVAQVADTFGRSERGIRDIRQRYQQTGKTTDQPRSGRPPILSHYQKKIIYRKARAEPKITYKELAKVAVVVNPDGTSSKPPSYPTLRRYLKRQGLTKSPCKKRPKLNRSHALRRLKFCREYSQFPWHRRTLRFSDECSFQKGSGQNQEWVFRNSQEKWKAIMLQTYGCGKKVAQMVWGSIWLDERGHARRSPLVIMERDPDAPNHGYSAKSYIKALTKGLLRSWRRSQLFMQDNARIHTAAATRNFLREHHITTINWPAYSPDLNPIEHLWWHLKKLMYKFYPQYNNYSKALEEWDGFCRALKECWRRIPAKLIRRLIMSMPRRIAACKKARGWQTKY